MTNSEEKKDKIVIADDFSEFPGARYKTDGPNSGEEFYEEVLKQKFDPVWSSDDRKLTIDFDRTYGFASSFISEVFIRLVKDYPDKKKLVDKLEIVATDDPYLEDSILEEIQKASGSK